MKTIKIFLMLAFASLVFASCSSDDECYDIGDFPSEAHEASDSMENVDSGN